MLDIKRKIQITLFVLVVLSSTLLGLSMESMSMILIGVLGAALGFLITDWLRWFRIDGILANIASIAILVLAMKDFFGVDSIGKLVAVANLLVYLQTVLLFQEKTPRLIWQVLVLSLLQVVVGAIFSLKLEAGILFLLYFGVAGLAMLLQSIYTDAFDIQRRNRRSARALAKLNSDEVSPAKLSLAKLSLAGASSISTQGSDVETEADRAAQLIAHHERTSRPLVFFDPVKNEDRRARSIYWHLGLWVVVSTIFTVVLFYMVPRHSRPWFGPAKSVGGAAGATKSVDLDQRGLLIQSGRVIFRVKVERRDGEEVQIEENSPYFRGLALSSLVIEDNKTNWRAPHDRVFKEIYQELPDSPWAGGIPVTQTITMEETSDPLVYGLMPFYRSSNTPAELSFCHEVSAITRSRIGDSISVAPYKYSSQTVIDEDGNFSKSWPYISNTASFSQSPMSDDPPQWKWLTDFDPERYPGLVKIAQNIADGVRDKPDAKLTMIRAMEKYFLDPSRYSYTVDFRNIDRDESVDPIEDFGCNHKTGHCELFASALTIMLRQQNVPARLVVGFYGAAQNKMTGNYIVREKNAHAWVEAYLGPEDCTPEMFESGQAGPGGAWVILDPTPYSFADQEAGVGEEAIDLARNAWDDYVLGVDSEQNQDKDSFTAPFLSLIQGLDVERMDQTFRNVSRFTRSAEFKYLIGGVVLFLLFLVWLRNRLKSTPTVGTKKKAGPIRRFVAGAISLIAPGLGQWVMKGTTVANPTKFYTRLSEILLNQEMEREPSQTHREFAKEVSNHFENHPAAGLIQSTVVEVTELFNEVRFGQVEIEKGLSDQVELSLNELEAAFE